MQYIFHLYLSSDHGYDTKDYQSLSSICFKACLHAASIFPSSAYFNSMTIPVRFSGASIRISLYPIPDSAFDFISQLDLYPRRPSKIP